jgi:hypothetical protein
MKAILLSFPFNNFSESGLFNELWPIHIKKSGALSGLHLVARRRPSRPLIQGGFYPCHHSDADPLFDQ